MVNGRQHLTDFTGTAAAAGTTFWPALLQATALMFVAYTGYGRIATLGEEVHEPRVTIPRDRCHAVDVGLQYVAVAVVAVASVGAGTLGGAARAEAAPARSGGPAVLGPRHAGRGGRRAMAAMSACC
jgi:APA family basic amino acid/polyamine antiporter